MGGGSSLTRWIECPRNGLGLRDLTFSVGEGRTSGRGRGLRYSVVLEYRVVVPDNPPPWFVDLENQINLSRLLCPGGVFPDCSPVDPLLDQSIYEMNHPFTQPGCNGDACSELFYFTWPGGDGGGGSEVLVSLDMTGACLENFSGGSSRVYRLSRLTV